jgi:hypothetical protein
MKKNAVSIDSKKFPLATDRAGPAACKGRMQEKPPRRLAEAAFST